MILRVCPLTRQPCRCADFAVTKICLDAKLRQRLAELGVPSQNIELEFARVMAEVARQKSMED